MSLKNLIQRKKVKNWKGKIAFEIGGCTALVVGFIASIYIIAQGVSIVFSGNFGGFFAFCFAVSIIYYAGGVVSWVIYAIYYITNAILIALVKAVKSFIN